MYREPHSSMFTLNMTDVTMAPWWSLTDMYTPLNNGILSGARHGPSANSTHDLLSMAPRKLVLFNRQKESQDLPPVSRLSRHDPNKECGCCYGSFKFEAMTQCSDGHLFCQPCLVRYAQEAVFGSGRAELSCMLAGGRCVRPYPARELERVLPEKVLRRYHERQAEEAALAAVAARDKLVRCPSCDFPALLDKGAVTFRCSNPGCGEVSCRMCRAPWELHVGKTCKQLQRACHANETRIRLLYEERMTAARVRRCSKCGVAVVKDEGCNNVTCRCGSHMCYGCRRPPSKCRCSWLDKVESDETIIRRIQEAGEAQLNKDKAYHTHQHIGPQLGPPPEKCRMSASDCTLVVLFWCCFVLLFGLITRTIYVSC